MSEWDQLRNRRVPPTPVVIRTAFTLEADAAHREHDEALRVFIEAEIRGADTVEHQPRLDAAKAALEPFVATLNVHVISAARYEELVGDHPPTEQQRGVGAQWNNATFVPAILAECVALASGARMAAPDWAEWIADPGGLAHGELNALYSACLAANDRSPDVQVGKGFGVTPS